MKFVRLIVLLTLSIFQTLISQTRLAPNTANKHDERGISTASSLFSESNEVIGDFDGNLSYVVPFKMDLQTEISASLTLTYNSNTEHRFFIGNGVGEVDRQDGYSINGPEWIIGINGIAIQTLNFELNYYIGASTDINKKWGLQGQEIPKLIPGYHFSNKLKALEGQSYPDIIEILKADGSKINLFRKYNTGYVGIYLEQGINNNGYAIVKSAGTETFPRKIWYKPGDGLTYYFEEESVKYNGVDNFMSSATTPKVMYLKSISSPTETININYGYLNISPMLNGVYLGRKFATDITLGNQLIGNISYSLNSTNNDNNTVTIGAYQSQGVTLNLKKLDVYPVLNYDRRNNIGSSATQTIASMTDAEARKTVFEYTNYPRNYRFQSGTGICDGSNAFCISSPNYDLPPSGRTQKK